MTNTAAPKFTQTHVFGLRDGSTGKRLSLASPGFPDIEIEKNTRLGGFVIYREGDDDAISLHRTQRDAKEAALEALAIDAEAVEADARVEAQERSYLL